MPEQRTGSRRHQILEALAAELESRPGVRITTAKLATAVGVSEAALYRHFPSKARMFEALFEFAEDSVFNLLNKIQNDRGDIARQLEHALGLLLKFSELNPGITRVLLGEALVGEHERLRTRSEQFFDRFETQLRQMLRDAGLEADNRAAFSASTMASLLSAAVEGRMARYSRTGFRRKPTAGWDQEWTVLRAAVVRERPAA